MKHIITPNNWSCLPCSFAMVLDISLEGFLRMVGHDGSEIWFPELEEPYCRRSFHPQEMIDVADFLGYSVTEFQARPCSSPAIAKQFVKEIPFSENRFVEHIKNNTGIIYGMGNRVPHAWAWNKEHAMCPNGGIYALDQIKKKIQGFYKVRI